MRPLIYTPGPTEVPSRVLRRMARPITNPDQDQRFFRLYDSLQEKLGRVMKTKSDVLVMSGEGYLGLEAAAASLVGKGDPVLCVANGVFGDGFADLVRLYGGKPVMVTAPYNRPVDVEDVKEALDGHRFRVATFVHCETPSAVLNPLEGVARACRKKGVVLVADVVSSLGGVPVETDAWGVDVALGASQKCFSSPPGLAIVSVSDAAWELVRSRKDAIQGYYASLWQWSEWWKKKRLFPYTPSISDINALDEALDMFLEEGLSKSIERHAAVSRFLLSSCKRMGLALYPAQDRFHSPTVTAFLRPPGVGEAELLGRMEDAYGVMISGSWGKLRGKVLRLGNMGFNAHRRKASRVARALEASLGDLGFSAR